MQFEIGQTVGDYRILSILGRGGMGAVYKVRNTLTDREEAMKVVLPGADAGSEAADRFLRDWFRARRYAGARNVCISEVRARACPQQSTLCIQARNIW